MVRLLLRLLHYQYVMVFRIAKDDCVNDVLLHIDGDLSVEGLSELDRVCAEIYKPLTIDLSGLTPADGSTVKAFRQMAREGVKLEGASPYLSLRLSRRDEGS